jgi:hypothetical protein
MDSVQINAKQKKIIAKAVAQQSPSLNLSKTFDNEAKTEPLTFEQQDYLANTVKEFHAEKSGLETPPQILRLMANLRKLYLRDNMLMAPSFPWLLRLTHLDVSKNLLQSPFLSETTPNIEVVDASGNLLTTSNIGVAGHIRSLSLAYNRLRDFDKQLFPALAQVELTGNEDIPQEVLQQLRESQLTRRPAAPYTQTTSETVLSDSSIASGNTIASGNRLAIQNRVALINITIESCFICGGHAREDKKRKEVLGFDDLAAIE